MPIFFQKEIDYSTRVGIWKIEEEESFFKGLVPVHRNVTHPHKRLQHLAGRFLLKYLYPHFPSELIQIADTRKPFLPDEAYHFSISHCGNYAAAIVSKKCRVGIDIELSNEKINRVKHKFINEAEKKQLDLSSTIQLIQLWSAKESVYKWYGKGGVDVSEDIHIHSFDPVKSQFACYFKKLDVPLEINYMQFNSLCASYISTPVR